MDPGGVAQRRQHRLNRRVYSSKVANSYPLTPFALSDLVYYQGPNFCWHIDGNDKLVPYGFGIHGGMDG